ncbi:hypothetical protein [Streptobacillus moniliformis]|uniref:hypothetical protein n=1 Tax=Streptobacillus moniliformis TaxID=34105 RepID=UPI0007E411D7|nr:hypothetical protein [Streptobacillus moniliformis]
MIIENESEKISLEKSEIFDLKYNFKSRNDSLVVGDKGLSITLGIKFLNDPNDSKIREKSKKVLESILEWVSQKHDYRKLMIEEILTEDEKIIYTFNNIYVDEMIKKYNVENIGEYIILLKQNLLEKNKIEIKKEK